MIALRPHIPTHPLRVAAVSLLVLVALAIPFFGSSFYISLASNILIYGLLAMSLDLIAGFTGMVSLTHASFLGIAAYGIAFGTSRGISPWISILIAFAAVLVGAVILGTTAVQVRGLTFVMITLALGQIVSALAFRWVSVSGGDNGVAIFGRPSIGPVQLNSGRNYYFFALVVFALCALALRRVVRSPFGLALQGIRENEARMATLGYRVKTMKLTAFVLAALFAGVAGVLFAFYNQFISPSTISFASNANTVVMVVLGGIGSLWGGLIGAGVLVVMQQFVSSFIERWVTMLGILFVVVILFFEGGLIGVGRQLRASMPNRRIANPDTEQEAKTPEAGDD